MRSVRSCPAVVVAERGAALDRAARVGEPHDGVPLCGRRDRLRAGPRRRRSCRSASTRSACSRSRARAPGLSMAMEGQRFSSS
jgi:hypothetical protein